MLINAGFPSGDPQYVPDDCIGLIWALKTPRLRGLTILIPFLARPGVTPFPGAFYSIYSNTGGNKKP